MRILSKNLKHDIESEVTTFATCWKLTLKNKKNLGFTDCTQDLRINNVDYLASTGFTSSAIEKNLGSKPDNMEVEAILDSSILKEEDILSGIYDHSELEVFIVNYLFPEEEKILLCKGWLGEITLKDNQFKAEIRGISQKLATNITINYSATCRANFGDQLCKMDKNQYEYQGVIEEIISKNQIKDTKRKEPKDYFTYGELIIFNDKLIQYKTQIKEYSNNIIVLFRPLPKAIKIGDKYEIYAGCDKKFSTCIDRFNNAVNFRGEPHLPGSNNMLKTAGTY